jgi:hypothetical protein
VLINRPLCKSTGNQRTTRNLSKSDLLKHIRRRQNRQTLMEACTMYFVFNTMINKDTEFPYTLCVFFIHIFCSFFPSKHRHRVAGGRRRRPRRSNAATGLIGTIRAWQAAGLDLDLIGPTTAPGQRSPEVVEGGSPLFGCRVARWL